MAVSAVCAVGNEEARDPQASRIEAITLHGDKFFAATLTATCLNVESLMMRLGAIFRHFLSCLWMLLAVGGLAACNSGPPATGIPHEVVIPPNDAKAMGLPDSTSAQGKYQGESEYRIGPHDLIEISVFQVDALSHKVRVNSKGMISLPLIGAVEAGGKTVSELEVDIANRLGSKYVRNPQVTVFVEEFTSQRVTVEGAVSKPGIYPLTGKTTLLQAIALVGGLDPLADAHSVVVFRTINGKKMAALFDIPRIRHSLMEDPLIFGDDIVVVDRSGSLSFLKGVTDTLRGFIGFGSIPITGR